MLFFQILIILILFFLNFSFQFNFNIIKNEQKCFEEKIKLDVFLIGNFNTSKENNFLDFQILNEKNEIIFEILNKKYGSFGFETRSEGIYQFCFKSIQNEKIEISFEFKQEIAKKFIEEEDITLKQIEYLEKQFEKIEKISKEMNEIIEGIEKEDQKFEELQKTTNSRILWLNLISILFLVFLGIWQYFHFKNYLQKKKII